MLLPVTVTQVVTVVLIVLFPIVPFSLYTWWILRKYGGGAATATGQTETTPFALLKVVSLLAAGAAFAVLAVILLAIWLF